MAPQVVGNDGGVAGGGDLPKRRFIHEGCFDCGGRCSHIVRDRQKTASESLFYEFARAARRHGTVCHGLERALVRFVVGGERIEDNLAPSHQLDGLTEGLRWHETRATIFFGRALPTVAANQQGQMCERVDEGEFDAAAEVGVDRDKIRGENVDGRHRAEHVENCLM
jgi:hypothetical protein